RLRKMQARFSRKNAGSDGEILDDGAIQREAGDVQGAAKAGAAIEAAGEGVEMRAFAARVAAADHPAEAGIGLRQAAEGGRTPPEVIGLRRQRYARIDPGMHEKQLAAFAVGGAAEAG